MQLQEKLLYQDKKFKRNSTGSGREERAQPLHLRQRRRQEGSATLIKEKEQRAEVLKTKDRRGAIEEVAPIPTFNAEIAEDCRKLWLDGKQKPTVQMRRL